MKQVIVNSGQEQVSLPNGRVYNGPVTVTLTDEQYDQIPTSAFDGVLSVALAADDPGRRVTVTDEPTPLNSDPSSFSRGSSITLRNSDGVHSVDLGGELVEFGTAFELRHGGTISLDLRDQMLYAVADTATEVVVHVLEVAK